VTEDGFFMHSLLFFPSSRCKLIDYLVELGHSGLLNIILVLNFCGSGFRLFWLIVFSKVPQFPGYSQKSLLVAGYKVVVHDFFVKCFEIFPASQRSTFFLSSI
jgi:hypothetical protein